MVSFLERLLIRINSNCSLYPVARGSGAHLFVGPSESLLLCCILHDVSRFACIDKSIEECKEG